MLWVFLLRVDIPMDTTPKYYQLAKLYSYRKGTLKVPVFHQLPHLMFEEVGQLDAGLCRGWKDAVPVFASNLAAMECLLVCLQDDHGTSSFQK